MWMKPIRPNVILLATGVIAIVLMLVSLSFDFLKSFVPAEAWWDGAVVGGIVSTIFLVMGAAIGGLVSTMSQVAVDPPEPDPPTVPADVHSELVKTALDKN